MSSLGEMLTEQEIDLMMGEAGANDGKVVMSNEHDGDDDEHDGKVGVNNVKVDDHDL